MNTRTYAVIDVGSNSVRLMIARAQDDRLSVLCRDRATTRLMNGAMDGVLFGESVERTAQAVAAFVHKARAMDADTIDAFGTSALRDAANRESFSDRTEELCGVRVKVVSGEEEARLAYAGAAPEGRCGVIDIGGGSTELIIGEHGRMLRAHSARIGAVRLMNLLEGRLSTSEMLLTSERLLAETVRIVCTDSPDKWIGVGGTITSLAAMTKKVDRYSPDAIEDFPLTADAADAWLRRLCCTTLEERRTLTGLNPARADVIPYGAAILLTVMRMTSAGAVHACDHDNLEGYIRSSMTPHA